jgi:hypothetical protein
MRHHVLQDRGYIGDIADGHASVDATDKGRKDPARPDLHEAGDAFRDHVLRGALPEDGLAELAEQLLVMAASVSGWALLFATIGTLAQETQFGDGWAMPSAAGPEEV